MHLPKISKFGSSQFDLYTQTQCTLGTVHYLLLGVRFAGGGNWNGHKTKHGDVESCANMYRYGKTIISHLIMLILYFNFIFGGYSLV